MRLRTLLFLSLFSLAIPSLQAQSARLDQSEVLGRLAGGYSPSYIGYLVKVRGLKFSPTEDFVYRVKLAGGEGILVERLRASDAAPSVISAADQDAPTRRLAKCAELIHTGAVESAEVECRAAMEENPKSPWPVIAVASLLEADPYRRSGWSLNAGFEKSRAELWERAAALAPDLPIVNRALATIQSSSRSATRMQKLPVDYSQFEITEITALSEVAGYFGDFGVANNAKEEAPKVGAKDEAEDRAEDEPDDEPAKEKSITLPPNVLRRMEIEPNLASNHLTVGVLYLRGSEFEKARQEFQEMTRLEPGVTTGHLLLGSMDFHVHENEAGLAEFRESIRIAPAGALEHLAMARALEALGRNSEAIDELRTTIAMHPTASEPSSNLIELYSKQKDRKSAIAELRRFLEVTSAAYADQQIFFQANWGYFDQLIRLLMEDHQLDAAGQEYQVMLRYRPNESVLHNDYGIVLLQQHRLDEALGQFNEAARINPQWSTPHHNIGLCLAQKNNLDGAIQEFRTTLELDPNEENTRIFLGSALGRKGDVAGAKEQFQKVIEKDPQDADAHLGVAYALGQMKDEAAAMKELKSALELKPDSPTAENDLAWLYATAEDAKLRDPAQALVLARQAVATSEEPNAAFLDTLAEALLINGQPVEALKYELQAAQLDPDNPEFLTRLPRFQAAVQPQVAAKR